jgi:plastocyanin
VTAGTLARKFPAERTVVSSPARFPRRAVAAAALVVCLGLPACGGPAAPGAAPSTDPSPTAATTSSSPESASPTTSASPSADTANRVVVDITIADGKVSPNGEKVDVAVGQEVELNVTSDVDDEIHAHTDSADGYALEVKAGVPTSGTFSVASAGSFEVESHDLEKIIVILNVR